MSIYRILADKLKATGIQDTAFSIDALGGRICSSWDQVNVANDIKPFNVVVIGAGMFGAYCAEKLYRRDTTEDPTKKLRILVLDAGPFFLPTHIQNLPLGKMSDDVVWARPWTGKGPYVAKDNGRGAAFCVGGRSLFWSGWSPELTQKDLDQWPQKIREFLKSDAGYWYTATEIGSNKRTGFIEDTDLHQALSKKFEKDQKKTYGKAVIDVIDDAPLAVLGSPPAPGIFPFEKFSSVTFLIDALNEDAATAEHRLMLLPRAEVIRLNLDKDKQAVTSLDLEVCGNARTLRLGSNTTVILANGTVEATRRALADLGVGREVSGRPRVGNFMTHMMNSIQVRIKRSALGLSTRPSKHNNELVAFRARGKAYERRLHYQIVAAALQPKVKGQDPWAFMMKMIPDLDQLDQLMSGHDDTWISVVFRGVAEMEGNSPLDPPDKWKNWISLEQGGDRAEVCLNPSKNDTKLWRAMDAAAIGLAKHLAPNSEDIQYKGANGWQPTELDAKALEGSHDNIGGYHEGGTLFMGDKGSSITDTSGKFHDLSNVYVVGPAVFPTLGSANPSLAGLTLARRTGDAILKARGITPPPPPPWLPPRPKS